MKPLIPDFYSIQSINKLDDTKHEIKVHLNADAEVYKGHFPGQPVAPGACLTQMVKEVVNTISGTDRMLSEAQQIKFLATINPHNTPNITLDLNITETDTGIKIKCTAKDANTSYFKISGTLV